MKGECSVTFSDILLGALLILVSAALILFPVKRAGTTVTVNTADSILSYPLDKNRTVEVVSEGHTLTLEILAGGVRVTESDCPDGLCVRMGKITDSSGVIVCAPAKVSVRISSPEGGDTDADFIIGG